MKQREISLRGDSSAGRAHGLDLRGHEWIGEVLSTVEYGTLAIRCRSGWPSAVPLNFVCTGGRIYCHGSRQGEKMDAIHADPRVGFTIVDQGSLIPSYWRHPRSACPATQYFRSVMIRGRARVVEAPREKALALQALMDKLQPEGGFEPIVSEDPLYEKALRGVGVVAIEIEHLSGKYKYGQSLNDEARARVLRGLEERGAALDAITIERVEGAQARATSVVLDAPAADPGS